MAEKKDFMKELARQVENEKNSNGNYEAENSQPYEEVEEIEEVDIPTFTKEDDEPVFNRPKSFQEETFKQVGEPKKKVSKKGIMSMIIAVVVVIVAIIVFTMMPKIKMPNFVGKKMGDVSNWAKQNKIENSAIAVGEPEFSFEYDKDLIMSQSVEEGKKVRKDTPITFVVSKGADPEEEVAFPDINSMNIDEIKEWIKSNKLTKAKVNTKYNDEVEEGEVISYKIKNGSETDFKRGTTITIDCSKGKAPAGKITMIDLVGKQFVDAENFAKQKKVNVEKLESYSDTKEIGLIISQSIPSGKTLAENDTFTVTVSKGKGIVLPNFVGYTKEQLEAWTGDKEHNVNMIPSPMYNNAPEGTVIAQKQAPGTVVDQGAPVEITVSKYLPLLCYESTNQWIGSNYQTLKIWCDEKNVYGANVQAGEYGDLANREYSDTVEKDGILEIRCTGPDGKEIDKLRPLPIGSRIAYRVSLGKKEVPVEDEYVVMTGDVLNSLASIQGFNDANKMQATYSSDLKGEENVVIKVNGQTYKSGDGFQIRVKQGDKVEVHYNPNYQAPTPNPQPEQTVEPTTAPTQES